MAKMMDKPKKGTKVKTIDRGQYAPNVTVKSIPEFKPKGPFPMLDLDYNKKTSDSTSKMKKGGKMKKYQGGGKVKTVDRGMLPNVTVKSNPELGLKNMEKWRNELNRDVQEMMKKRDSTAAKKKMGGKVKKAQSGASLKPVPAGKKGLAKLPTPVRNKMGFQKNGGKVKK